MKYEGFGTSLGKFWILLYSALHFELDDLPMRCAHLLNSKLHSELKVDWSFDLFYCCDLEKGSESGWEFHSMQTYRHSWHWEDILMCCDYSCWSWIWIPYSCNHIFGLCATYDLWHHFHSFTGCAVLHAGRASALSAVISYVVVWKLQITAANCLYDISTSSDNY